MLAAGTIDQLGCLVIDGEGWHRGVLGILASRVVERTGHPALVLSHEDGEAHGSGRSIPGFHLLEALESCHDVFVRFGGHAHAVGFSLTSARVPELRERLQQHATTRLTPQILERKLDCSAELPLYQIDMPFYQSLRLLEPYGMGNEEPVFIARNLILDAPPQIMKDEHIRMRLRDDQTVMKALGWRWAERVRALALDHGSRIDLAYRLRMNEHPGFRWVGVGDCGFATELNLGISSSQIAVRFCRHPLNRSVFGTLSRACDTAKDNAVLCQKCACEQANGALSEFTGHYVVLLRRVLIGLLSRPNDAIELQQMKHTARHR